MKKRVLSIIALMCCILETFCMPVGATNLDQDEAEIIGKDEVGSSNLPSSSKKHRKLRFSMLFCCKNAGNGVGQNVGQLPDPHRDPHAKMCG